MKVLFDSSGNPHPEAYVREMCDGFRPELQLDHTSNYQGDWKTGIDEGIFLNNAAKLMSNFKMTRRGPFKGVGFSRGNGPDNDQGILSASWKTIGESVLDLKQFLISRANTTRVAGSCRNIGDRKKPGGGKIMGHVQTAVTSMHE